MALKTSLPPRSKTLLTPRPSRQQNMRAALAAAHSAWVGYYHLTFGRASMHVARAAMPGQRPNDVRPDIAPSAALPKLASARPNVQHPPKPSMAPWQQHLQRRQQRQQQRQQQQQRQGPQQPSSPSSQQPGQPPNTQRMVYRGPPDSLPRPQPQHQQQQQPLAHPLPLRAPPPPVPRPPAVRHPVGSPAAHGQAASQAPHGPSGAKPSLFRPKSAPPAVTEQHGAFAPQQPPPGGPKHMQAPGTPPLSRMPPGPVRKTPPVSDSTRAGAKSRSPSPGGASKQPLLKPEPLWKLYYRCTPPASTTADADARAPSAHAVQQQQQQQQQELEEGLWQFLTGPEADISPMYTTECLNATDEPSIAVSHSSSADAGSSMGVGADVNDAATGLTAGVAGDQQELHATVLSHYDEYKKAAARAAEERRKREEQQTRRGKGQRTAEWLALRHGRLTASAFSNALGFWDRLNDKRMAELWAEKTGLGPAPITNEAMQHGTDNEPIALAAYKKLAPGHEVEQRDFEVRKWDDAHDWLGASPDGVITVTHTYSDNVPGQGRGVLEIKCPYNGGRPDTCTPDKINSYGYYMPQVQGLMYMLDAQWCNLYVWTPQHGSALAHIVRDGEYWAVAESALAHFWWCHVVPAKLALAQGMPEAEVRKRYEPTRILLQHLDYLKKRGNAMIRAAPRREFDQQATFDAASHMNGKLVDGGSSAATDAET